MSFDIYTAEGDKYDHRQDPNDVTGLCEADHELRDQMLKMGYVVRWAIDGRYRLTELGRREKAKRTEEIQRARLQGAVGPLLPQNEKRALKENNDEHDS